jgi:hypothetical protein
MAWGNSYNMHHIIKENSSQLLFYMFYDPTLLDPAAYPVGSGNLLLQHNWLKGMHCTPVNWLMWADFSTDGRTKIIGPSG